MPNYCDYEMKLVGKKENLIKAYNIIKAGYSYNSDGTVECDADQHLFRVFEALYEGFEHNANSVEESIDKYGGGNTLIISGYCAWSISSCMFEGNQTYYSDWTKEYKDKYECFKGTTIDRISKDYDLDIEIFSEEGGQCFMEHYLIEHGKITINECYDYEEIYNEETGEFETSGGIEWDYAI